jgi:hypothetical protein
MNQLKVKFMKDQEKVWVCKAILTASNYITFQHEQEALSIMYDKYNGDYPISEQELKDDLRYIEKFGN